MPNFYIFHGDEYVRHSYGQGPDPGYPLKIYDHWRGWPESWRVVQMDAATFYPANSKFYIFHDDEYVRHSPGQGPDPGYPMKICDRWSGWPGSWAPSPAAMVDAVLYYPGNEKFYIFHGDEYVRHSYGRGPDPDYPKKIRNHWSGWPGSWTAPIVRAIEYYPGNDRIYLFNSDEYVRHSFDHGPDDGYPRRIDDVWSGWPHVEWANPPGETPIKIDAVVYYP